MRKLFIIIPTYNGIKDTIVCLKTLPILKHDNVEVKTIIVDNASTDGTQDLLEKEKSTYNLEKIIKNEKNLGFAKAVNLGIRYALKLDADYIFLLNSDTEIRENFLPSLIKSGKDIISPVVQFPLSPGQKDYRYDYGGFINWWTGRTYHDDKTKYLQPTTYNLQPLEVDYMSGCSLLIKKEVFEKIGLFDERFFMYFEDVDFCVRAKKAGFEVAVDPKFFIFHKLGGSIIRWSIKAIFYNITSNAIFIIKHYGWRIPIALGYLSLLTTKIILDKVIYKVKAL